MKVVSEVLDMEKTKANWPPDKPFAPAMIKNRRHDKAHWIVLSQPLLPGGVPEWAYTEHDEYIRVPLFPYKLSPHADLALAFMLQLGLSCAGNLPGRVTGFYVVTGRPVELMYDPDTDENVGLRCWVGFAVTVEDT